MPHADRVPKLDKQQRTMLQELGAGELLALVLEPLRTKVAKMGLEEDAVELIDLLESERACCAHIHDQDKQEESQVALRPQDHGSYEHCWLGGGCWLQPDGCRLP